MSMAWLSAAAAAALLQATATPQILSPTKLAEYRSALPHVAAPRIQAMLDDERTFWYDADAMIPSYQDSVGDGQGTPIGARANSAGKPIIVPEGKKFFSADGRTWSFPFGHTAGTDDSDNVAVADFIHLPMNGARQMPIVYSIVNDPRGRSGLGLHQWTWMFPRGTVIGEMIYVRDDAGQLFPVELRTRTRQETSWSVNIFRPFPEATDLSEAVKRLRPSWQSDSTLRALVAHLENPRTLTAKTLTSPGFDNVFQASGWLDVIPSFGDDDLVRELLSTTPFVAAYGAVWKQDGDDATYAASTNAAFSIVPRRYFAGLLEVTDESCARCHAEAGRGLDSFEWATILYGDLWGSDRIFSFHPWDQSRYGTFNTENRSVRPELTASGLVERYDAARHPAAYYRALAP
jgi:hypothetical protein